MDVCVYVIDELEHRLTDRHGSWNEYVFFFLRRFLWYPFCCKSPTDGAAAHVCMQN